MRDHFWNSQTWKPFAKPDNDETPLNIISQSDESMVEIGDKASTVSCDFESMVYKEGITNGQPPTFDYAATHLSLNSETTKALHWAVKNNKYSNRAKVLTEMEIGLERIGPSHFRAIKLLGIGSFGEVFLVQKKDSKMLYAMKILKKDKVLSNNLVRYVKTERNVLSISSHFFICGIDFAFQTSDRLFLILDFCPGGDLSQYLKEEDFFPEEKAKKYVCEVLLALEDLHKWGIIFWDLKPENIVLDEFGHVKVTDFGLSKEGVDQGEVSKSFCGSYAYLAPEMVKKQGHSNVLDWYLLGVLLFELLEGIPPFYDNDKDVLFDNIIHNHLELSDDLSDEVVDLLENLLEKDPKKWLGKNGAAEIKAHRWFSDVDWKIVENRGLVMPRPYLMKSEKDLLAPPRKAKSMKIACKNAKQDQQTKMEKQNTLKMKQFNEMINEEAKDHNKISCWSYVNEDNS
jgi:serine/threonine protein kinase